jgi:hypothetical protein
MPVYVADTFRGSGSIHNSPPEDKHASVGNWTIYSIGEWNPGPPGEDSYQVLKRSANGLTGHAPAFSTDTSSPLVRAAGEVSLGAGVFVAETRMFGAVALSIRANSAGSVITMTGNPNEWTFSFGATNTWGSDSNPRGLADPTVLRVEIDSTLSEVRGYADGVLVAQVSGAGLTHVSSIQAWKNAWTGVYGASPILIADYVNAQLNTVSGPLGSPSVLQGATYSLPKIVVDGRVFLRGNGGVLLPALAFDGGELAHTTVIWDKLVRCRERR